MTKDMPTRKRTRARPGPGVSTASQAQPAPLSSPEVEDSPDYEVGYKKPPGHSQFKAGQSGNPKGRPKGSKNLKTELAEELQELISIREGGARRTISKQRAMLKGLTAKAVQGDARAASLVLNLVLRLLSQDEDGGARRPQGRRSGDLGRFRTAPRGARHETIGEETWLRENIGLMHSFGSTSHSSFRKAWKRCHPVRPTITTGTSTASDGIWSNAGRATSRG